MGWIVTVEQDLCEASVMPAKHVDRALYEALLHEEPLVLNPETGENEYRLQLDVLRGSCKNPALTEKQVDESLRALMTLGCLRGIGWIKRIGCTA